MARLHEAWQRRERRRHEERRSDPGDQREGQRQHEVVHQDESAEGARPKQVGHDHAAAAGEAIGGGAHHRTEEHARDHIRQEDQPDCPRGVEAIDRDHHQRDQRRPRPERGLAERHKEPAPSRLGRQQIEDARHPVGESELRRSARRPGGWAALSRPSPPSQMVLATPPHEGLPLSYLVSSQSYCTDCIQEPVH
jgi:hypothetical protein